MKWLFSLFAVVVVLVLGALVAPSFVDWNQYKGQALEQVTKFTGLKAEIEGDVSLAVLPSPRVSLEKVRVADPSTVDKNLVSLDEVKVHLALVPLLSGKISVSSISLDAPNIRLVKSKDGVFNFVTPEIDSLMGAKKAVAPEAGSNVQIGFESIEIENGVFTYEDIQTKAVHKVDNIDLDVEANSLQGPFKGEGGLRYNGKAILFDGKTGRLEGQSASLNTRLTVDGVQAVYDGVVAWGGAAGAQGKLDVNISDLSKFAPGSPYKTFQARGALEADAQSFALKDATFQADDLNFTGSAEGALKDDGLKALAKLRGLPGQGLVDVKVEGDKGFKSVGFGVKGQAADAPLLLSLVSDVRGMPLIGSSKKVVFDVKGTKTPKGLLVEDATINLDALKVSASGSLMGQEKSSRQLLKVEATVSELNMDAMGGGGSSSGDPMAGLKALELPMDVDADVMINSATFQGQSISGLSLDAKILQNRLILDDVGVQDFVGAKAKVSGTVGNLQALSGLDLTISASAADPKKTAQAFKIDTASWPKTLGQASADIKAKGDLQTLAVNAAVKAMGGQFDVKGTASNPLTGFSMKSADIRIKHKSLKGALAAAGIEAPAFKSLSKPIDVKAFLAMGQNSYTLSKISGNLSGTPINASAKIDLSGTKPYLAGDFKFGRVVLEGVGGSKSSGGSSKSSKSSGGGKWSSAPLNSDWLHSMNADLSVSADSMLYEGWDMNKPSMRMTLNNGVMTLSDLQAGLYDGQIGMKGTMSSAKPGASTSMSGNVSIQNVNMEPLVKAFAGERIVKGQGRVSVQSDVSGLGGSMKALIESLSGQGTVSGSQIVLDGIDVSEFVRALSDDAKPGDSLMSLWSGASQGGSTSFDTLDGAFVIQKGIINLQKMLLDSPTSYIDTKGAVNLPQWTIATQHTMGVKGENEVPPFTMKISGSLDNPGQTFAQGAINDFLQRKITRKIGKLLGDKVDADNPLGGVINNLLGGAPAQQQPANDNRAPANDNAPPAQQEQQQPQQEVDPEEAIKGLIKGLF